MPEVQTKRRKTLYNLQKIQRGAKLFIQYPLKKTETDTLYCTLYSRAPYFFMMKKIKQFGVFPLRLEGTSGMP
jgi:hypothetical protein